MMHGFDKQRWNGHIVEQPMSKGHLAQSHLKGPITCIVYILHCIV